MKICVVHAGRRDGYFLSEIFSEHEVHLITDFYNRKNYLSYILSLIGLNVKVRESNNKALKVHYNIRLLSLQFLELFLKRNSKIYKLRSIFLSQLFLKKNKIHKFDIVVFYYNSGASYAFRKENLTCKKILFQMHPHPQFTLNKYNLYLKDKNKYPYLKLIDEEEEFNKDQIYLNNLNSELLLADHVLITSSIIECSIENLVGKDKIIKIPYPRKTKISKNVKYKIKDRININYIGQFVVRKGVYELIDFVKNSDDYHLTIYTRDKVLINHPNVTVKYDFPSDIIWNEIQQRGHYLILNSLLEGFGLVLIEAIENGVPILSTKNSIADDIVIQGKVNGFLYDDISFLSSHLKHIQNANLKLSYETDFFDYQTIISERLF